MTNKDHPAVEKLRTGISSLDIIAKGGLPKNRTTLISGTAGSGKTVFAVHFLAAGINQGGRCNLRDPPAIPNLNEAVLLHSDNGGYQV